MKWLKFLNQLKFYGSILGVIPKVSVESHKWLSTVTGMSMGNHFLANFTIEKIGNEAMTFT